MAALTRAQEGLEQAWKEKRTQPAEYLKAMKNLVERETRPRVQAVLRGELETASRSAASYSAIGQTLEALIGVPADAIAAAYGPNRQLFLEQAPELAAVLDATTDWSNFHRAYVEGEKGRREDKRSARKAPK